MSDDKRTALIAAGASILVGLLSGAVTYTVAQRDVTAKVQEMSLVHSKDISVAVHDSLDDLFAKNDSGRVKATVASLYFLGVNADERKQIVETAGLAGTADVRNGISAVLNLDHRFGHTIAIDPDVIAIIVPANHVAAVAAGSVKPRDAGAAHKADALDYTLSRLNGSGWVYLGQAPAKTLTLQSDVAVKPAGSIAKGSVVTFLKPIDLRRDSPDQAGLAQVVGTIPSGENAVILDTRSYGLRKGTDVVWGEVFLCDASVTVSRPDAARACSGSTAAQ